MGFLNFFKCLYHNSNPDWIGRKVAMLPLDHFNLVSEDLWSGGD